MSLALRYASLLSLESQEHDTISCGLRNVSLFGFSSLLYLAENADFRPFKRSPPTAAPHSTAKGDIEKEWRRKKMQHKWSEGKARNSNSKSSPGQAGLEALILQQNLESDLERAGQSPA